MCVFGFFFVVIRLNEVLTILKHTGAFDVALLITISNHIIVPIALLYFSLTDVNFVLICISSFAFFKM